MDTATESTADVLRRAKRVLIERGWQPRANPSPPSGGRCCALNALALVDVPQCLMRQAEGALAAAAHVRSVFDIPAWNDQQESAAPVLDAFDAAIALAERETA